MESESINLQLGDIIQLNAPSNNEINEKIFLIDYWDEKIIKLINDEDSEPLILNITDDGSISDESITSISILSRPEEKGYARQNDLLPGNYIDIYFDGDLPVVITGEITNLEEDMIEVKRVDNKEVIYIDFAYKGIPKNIPIDKIITRPKPENLKKSTNDEKESDEKESDEKVSDEKVSDEKVSDEKVSDEKESDGKKNVTDTLEEGEIDEEYEDLEEGLRFEIPLEEVKENIKDILLDADQIDFGESIGVISQTEEVSESEKRFSLESQLNDLLDELLSNIPDKDRTRNVLNNIHQQVERFKQLRNMFSKIDANGNAIIPIYKGSDYKPLVKSLQELNFKLYWIIPVVQNQKKLYDLETLEVENTDVISLTTADYLNNMYETRELYKTNNENYTNYVKKLQEIQRPFLTTDDSDIINMKQVEENIDAIVNNLGDFYSSIYKNELVKRKRFLISKYNLGFKKLDPIKITSTQALTKRVPLTQSDRMGVYSYVTLPHAVTTFSNITLPNTFIIDKTNYNKNFLNYWQVFKENTKINNIYIDNLDKEIEFDKDDYLKQVSNYLLSIENPNQADYEEYLKLIIPKTRVLFNLIKNYMKGQLSLVSVVKYLQPFLIYLNDLSFKQYEEIVDYIEKKILKHKQELVVKKQLFQLIGKSALNNYYYESVLLKLLKSKNDLYDTVLKEYNLEGKYEGSLNDGNTILSNSEILQRMMVIDYTKTLNSFLSYINSDLFTTFDFDELLREKNKIYEETLKSKEENNKCKDYVLSKRYIDIDDLMADNNIEVYFDKKFDPTVYDILNEYKLQQSQMDEGDFKKFLTNQLIDNIGLKKTDALHEATSMIQGKRSIKDGQYALLEIDNIDNINYFYYIRKDNVWEKDESIPNIPYFEKENLFCNIQEKCIEINQKCATNTLANELVKKDLIKQMYDEFDLNYKESFEKYREFLNKKFEYNLKNLSKLTKIHKYSLYKYELKNLLFVNKYEINENEDSPYLHCFKLIVGQEDFVKKQHNIIDFVNKYTRPPLELNNEDMFWYYCKETNKKLMPSFYSKLASVFVENGNYMETLNEIKKNQGIIEDDYIVDKYSGYTIEKVALNSEEDFDTAGMKVKSREILEMDSGSIVTSSLKSNPLSKLLVNPKALVINNILTTMSNFIGINLDHHREEIIKHALVALENTLDTEENYMEKNKGKKIKPYDEVLNLSILLYTLSFLTVFIQVSIPSITSKKNFPGCSASFYGYPLTGEENVSNIKYIACISSKIKSSIKPWKYLPKSQDKIYTSIKKTIDSYVIKQGDINVLIEEKKIYLQQNENDFIPIELDLKNWVTFLPPLQPINNKTPENLSSQFKQALLENTKKGSKEQFEKINVVLSKVIYFSMAIIQCIEEVVKKEKLLLTNSNDVPYLQNSCCNTGEYKTLDYFKSKDAKISKFNEMVNYLNNIIIDINTISKPSILLDSANTKTEFPKLNKEFSENTIYRAFIEYCNFNNNIPIDEKLLSYCVNKPQDINSADSIDKKIDILKKNNILYTKQSFETLMDIINKENIIPLDLVHSEYSIIEQVRSIINTMKNSQNNIGREFLDLFYNVLDDYELKKNEESTNIREFRNYLSEKNKETLLFINDFIFKYSKSTIDEKNKIIDCVNNIDIFNEINGTFYVSSEDQTTFKMVDFLKNAIFSFIYVFPEIIVNNVNYDSILINKYWKLSEFHKNDIKKLISKYYLPLNSLQQSKQMVFNNYIKDIQIELKDFFQLVNLTNLFASIHNKGESIESILNNRTIHMLFKYYFLHMIKSFIDKKGIITNIEKDEKVQDEIITTVEIEEEVTGEINELSIIKAEEKEEKQGFANLIISMLQIICNEKNKININEKMIHKKINSYKDRERNKITSTLRDMSKEKREIENLFKNHRLERWNKGLQKGLTQYVKKTYDEERMDREADEILQKQLDDRKLQQQAFVADKEIETLQHLENQIVEDRINEDVYNLNDLPNDDELNDDYDYMLDELED